MRRNPLDLVVELVVGLIALYVVVVLAGLFLLANPILIPVVVAVGYGAYRLFKKPKQGEEAEGELKLLYDELASLKTREDENGEPSPNIVAFTADAWEVFKDLARTLQDEAHAPGLLARLEGAWSKMEAYLARLALILALCRVAERGGAEQVEPGDVLAAWVLVEYFKAHARRVHVGLRGESPDERLEADLGEFLRDRGGSWEGKPSELWEALVEGGSEAVPDRPDELSKKVRAFARRGTWLALGEGEWRKEDNKSRRNLRLNLTNGVDGVVGVGSEAP